MVAIPGPRASDYHEAAMLRPTFHSETQSSSSSSRLSSLFNWNPGSNIGKRKCKWLGGSHKVESGPSKRKKIPTWTHTFVCLSSTSQEMLLDGDERASLQIAGLGKKKIIFYASSEAQEIYEELNSSAIFQNCLGSSF